MKRTIIGAAVLALGLTGMATTYAGDDNPGARKSPLVVATTDENTQCESSESSEAETGAVSGFVLLNAPGKPDAAQKVNGEVSLKSGLPDHEYTVWLSDADGPCLPDGVLTTNGQGHGNAHINFDELTSGTYFVVLKDMDKEAFASAPVTLR